MKKKEYTSLQELLKIISSPNHLPTITNTGDIDFLSLAERIVNTAKCQFKNTSPAHYKIEYVRC